mmetsp:Transcript_49409/g.148885  ORF Transcript_49409/g.148885 Transcript_49409/m.148885 type:complete len:165 (-) Transcript_49409:2176-2670(-)
MDRPDAPLSQVIKQIIYTVRASSLSRRVTPVLGSYSVQFQFQLQFASSSSSNVTLSLPYRCSHMGSLFAIHLSSLHGSPPSSQHIRQHPGSHIISGAPAPVAAPSDVRGAQSAATSVSLDSAGQTASSRLPERELSSRRSRRSSVRLATEDGTSPVNRFRLSSR